MALQTKSITANGSKGHHTFTLTITENSTNINNNTSNISFNFVLSPLVRNWDWLYNNSVPVSYTITINGTNYTGNIMKYDGVSTVSVHSGTVDIPHNTDGSKTINFSFSVVSHYNNSVVPGSAAASGNMVLTSIPKGAEIISASMFYDDQNPTITYSNPAGYAVSTLEVCISADGTTPHIAYRPVSKTGTSFTFSLTDDERETLWNVFLNKTRAADAYFILKTVLNGKTSYSTFHGAVEIRNNAPIVAINVEDINESTYAYTGSHYRAIKGYNDIQVFVDAEPLKGANIVEYRIKNGNTVSNNPTTVFTNTEYPDFEITVIDDRGAATTVKHTITMVDYYNPTCNLKASAEIVSETTARITVEVSGSWFNKSFGALNNTRAIKYHYKTNGGSYASWQTISDVAVQTNGNYTATATIDLDYRESYVFQAVIQDFPNPDGVLSVEVPIRIIPLFDWSNEDFNFNIPISFNGQKMNDFVVEQGTYNGWSYRLWDSGQAECWRRLQITTAVSSSWGGLYTSGSLASTNLSYPFEFVETPVLSVSLMPFGSGGLIMATGNGYGSATQTGPFEIARGTSLSSGQFLLAYHARGKWR